MARCYAVPLPSRGRVIGRLPGSRQRLRYGAPVAASDLTPPSAGAPVEAPSSGAAEAPGPSPPEHRQVRFRTPPGATELLDRPPRRVRRLPSRRAVHAGGRPRRPAPAPQRRGARRCSSPNGWRERRSTPSTSRSCSGPPRPRRPSPSTGPRPGASNPTSTRSTSGSGRADCCARKAAEQDPVYLAGAGCGGLGPHPRRGVVRGAEPTLRAGRPADPRRPSRSAGGGVRARRRHRGAARARRRLPPLRLRRCRQRLDPAPRRQRRRLELRCYNDTAHLGPFTTEPEALT